MTIYSGIPQNIETACGVAFMTCNTWESKIVNYSYISERTVTIRQKIDRGHLTVPVEEKREEIIGFYDTLQMVLNKVLNQITPVLLQILMLEWGNFPLQKW